MMKTNTRLGGLLKATGLLSCMIFLSGCFPGVAWLPDSSGFIYTSGKEYQRLALYDVTKKKQTVLVEDTKAQTIWPAVSPDGKQIALVRLSEDKDKDIALQIVVYDRAGKEVKHSKVFPWKKQMKKKGDLTDLLLLPAAQAPQLFWSPQGNRILVSAFAHNAIYDLKTDALTYRRQGVLYIFGGSPIRPDGAGFLVAAIDLDAIGKQPAKEKKEDSYFFVDWNGREKSLEIPATVKDEFDKLKDLKNVDKLMDPIILIAGFCPAIGDSRWDGHVALTTGFPMQFRYDCEKLRFDMRPIIKPELTEDGQLIRQRHTFPGTKVSVRTVFLAAKVKGARGPDDIKVRVETVTPNAAQPRVLFNATSFCSMIPAPDGKHLAILCLDPRSGEKKGEERPPDQRILVVNQEGELVVGIDQTK
jgi:hypothetical protein